MNKQDVVAVVLGGPSSEAEVSRRTGGAIAEALAEGVRKALGKEVTYIPKLPKAEEYLEAKATAGDLILTVGAGDVFKVGEELVRELERKNR